MAKLLSKSLHQSVYRYSLRFLFFICSWLYLWLMYGDVLFQLQEQSLWFFASPSEFDALKVHIDYFTYFARFCLTIFAIPALGALVLSVILSLIEFLTDCILKLNNTLYILSYIPSIVLMFIICSNDKTLFYGSENSTIFKVLSIVIVVFLFLLLICSIFRNKKYKMVENVKIKHFLFSFSLLLLSIFFVNVYASSDKEFRTIVSLKYYTHLCKWSKVASIAEESNIDSKVVAGYHALALAQLGQIGDRLFNVGYDFPEQKSFAKVDDIMQGSVLCNSDVLFYGGLTQPAYHYAFEYFIIYGNYKGYLKMMAKSLVLNNDVVLADRMLDIIERIPFESDFVKRYRYFNHNQSEMVKDPELAPVLDLKQPNEIFEQGFSKPLISNFYMRASSRGRSPRFQDLSLAACLYYKNLQLFSMKCNVLLKRNMIPKSFQEAVAMIVASNGHTDLLELYKISPKINASVQAFMTEQAKHRNEPDKGKAALSSFRGTLMYYIFFENENTIKVK